MYVPARMIAALVFVLAFIALGLTVVFVAFGGGPRSDRRPRGAPSRASRRVVAVAVAIVVVGLGVAVPLAVGVVNGDDHAKNAPGGVDLNAAQTAGRSTFAKYCSTCHTLKASNAVGKVGPNLDVLIGGINGTKQQRALILDAIKKGRANGRGQMPAGVVDGQDAQDVASYVAAVAGRSQ
jgi:mono/diheme cytochrome c family protein